MFSKIRASSIMFMSGTFFEIIVCVSISMKMLTIYEFLNSSDVVSLFFQFLFLISVLFFIGFVSYFAFGVSAKLVIYYKGNSLISKRQKLKKIRETFRRKS